MLSPGAPALDREQAMKIVSQLEDAEQRPPTSALASPSVQEAARLLRWREVYACVPLEGGRLLEGYIDLLYRGPDGLVVVDYKTAATSHPGELDRRVDGYRLQGASYALAMGAVTDEPVSRVTFLFLTPEGAVERHLEKLDTALARVRALAAAGQALTVDESGDGP
jgi:ATP-dependent helicase/nuclease subunit A